MNIELDTLNRNKTWKLVPRPKNKSVLTNRWVFMTKYNQDGTIKKRKARLVARGHTQRKGIDYEDVFAPVARYETIRALLAMAVECEMHVHHIDVVSTYTQGNLEDETYMEQPKSTERNGNENMVCKLLKPLYGLKQSGREWYKELDKYITAQGMHRTEADPCVYVLGKDDNKVIMVIYVDDIVLASRNMNKLDEAKSILKSRFEITDLGQTIIFSALKSQEKEQLVI